MMYIFMTGCTYNIKVSHEQRIVKKNKCPEVQTEGFEKTLTVTDMQTILNAKRKCRVGYGKCLKKLIKKKNGHYNAICGRKM